MHGKDWLAGTLRAMFGAPVNDEASESLKRIIEVANRIDERVEKIEQDLGAHMETSRTNDSELSQAISDIAGRL